MLVGSCMLEFHHFLNLNYFLFQWILDAIICNGGGIYLGMKTCEYLKMKPYNWRGLWTIPTVRYDQKFLS